jgi:peptide/nickel transport system substrate-binding protein
MTSNDFDQAPGGRPTRRAFIRGAAGVAAGAALPGLLAACSSGSSSSATSSATSAGGTAGGTPKRGGHLIIGLSDGGSSDVLSPWVTPYYSAAARAQQVFERLFTYGPQSQAVPQLALSAEANADATVWRVQLRPGVTFHNGKTLTADDVLYSFRYVANPKNNAESLPRLAPVDLNNSRAVSPTEVEFQMRRPIGDFKSLTCEKDLWIVPEGTTDFTKTLVGTGPYTYSSGQIGVRYLFQRNPHYWETGSHGGPPWTDSVQIQILPDNTARLNALQGGQIQEMTFIDFASAKANEGGSTITVIRSPQPNTSPIYFQVDAPQFRDVRVRQAMKLAMNRTAMVKDILLGYGSLGNDLFGKGQPVYNHSLPQWAYDPEKAASLLKQAGAHPLNLTLPTADAAPGMVQAAVAFKQDAAAAGINITLQKIDPGTYFGNNLYLKAPFYETQWAQGFESQALDGLVLNAPYNETHWYDKQWTNAFYAAEGILDDAKRAAAFEALQVPLWREGGYLIWGVYETLDAVTPNVRGIVPYNSNGFGNLGGFNFKYHWLA